MIKVRHNPGLMTGYSFLKQHSKQIPKLPESNNCKWRKERINGVSENDVFQEDGQRLSLLEYSPAFHSNRDYPSQVDEVPKVITIMTTKLSRYRESLATLLNTVLTASDKPTAVGIFEVLKKKKYLKHFVLLLNIFIFIIYFIIAVISPFITHFFKLSKVHSKQIYTWIELVKKIKWS